MSTSNRWEETTPQRARRTVREELLSLPSDDDCSPNAAHALRPLTLVQPGLVCLPGGPSSPPVAFDLVKGSEEVGQEGGREPVVGRVGEGEGVDCRWCLRVGVGDLDEGHG